MLLRLALLTTATLFVALGMLPAQDQKDKPDPDKKAEAERKKAEAIKKEKQRLQGTWQVLDWVNSGEAQPAAEAQQIRVVFSGDKMTMSLPKAPLATREYSFTIDPTQKPKTIDTSAEMTKIKIKTKATTAGIYELEDDTLRLCLARFGSQLRPKEFESKSGAGSVLITLKRAKK